MPRFSLRCTYFFKLIPPINGQLMYKIFNLQLIFVFQPLLLKVGVVQMFSKVLESCIGATNSDAKQFSESRNASKCGFSRLSWCIPIFKSVNLICGSSTCLRYPGIYER